MAWGLIRKAWRAALVAIGVLGCCLAQAGATLDDAVAAVAKRLRAIPEATRAGEVATERYLGGLAAAALSVYEQSRHLDHPSFFTSDAIEGRPGLVNPDNLYSSALLAESGRYRIRGVRGSHALLSLQILDSYPIVGLGRNLMVVDLDAMGIKSGNTFEVLLGGDERPGHWIAMPKGARALLARQTFVDWLAETPSRMSIERLDRPAPAVAPEELPATGGDYLLAATRTWNEVYLAAIRKLPVNQLPPPRPSDTAAGGLGGQQSVMARYRVAPGQALIVTARKTTARYQGLQIGDPWFVTPHFIAHQVSLNQAQAAVDADGKIRYVLSLTDPGAANWIDLAGIAEGYVFLRWQGLGRDLAPDEAPRLELVELDDLASRLPAETRRLTPLQRAAQLTERGKAPIRQR